MEYILLIVQTILQILTLAVFLSQVQGNTCEVGQERYDGRWMWVLATTNPCQCTRIVLGGMNTMTPKRTFEPIYVKEPLISEDIEIIRKHFNLTCDEHDNTDPTISGMPGDMAANTNSIPATFGTVIWPEPIADDNSAIVTLTSSHSPGDTFQLGNTTVTYTANDSAGNVVTETFMVTIKECCPCPVGMKNRSFIPDVRITASSYRTTEDNREPYHARLGSSSFWVSGWEDNKWIQVDLNETFLVTGLQTQGNGNKGDWQYWVSEIMVKIGIESNHLDYIKDDNGSNKVFKANDDAVEIINITLDADGASTRFVRVYPTKCRKNGDKWGACTMRFDIIGCRRF